MKQFSRFFILSSVAFVSIVGIATFFRWQFDAASFHSFTFYFGNINPTVAIGLIINAVLLLLLQNIKPYQKNKILTIKFFSLLFFLVGAAKLFSIVFHFDLLVDKILFSNKLPTDILVNPQKGMSFYAALNFMLLGISFPIIVAHSILLKRAINYLLLLAFFNCLFGLMGHLFHAPALINVEGFHPMLWSVSLCFSLLFLSVLLINKGYTFMYQFGSHQAGGRFARILLPLAILLPIILGYLSIWMHWHFEVNYELGLSALVFVIIIVMFFTTWFVAVMLNDFDSKQHDWERKENMRLETVVDERSRQLSQAQKESDDYKFALDEASIVAITDQKGIIKYVNNNFCKISKYSKEELIGQDHRIVNSGYHSKDFMQELWRTIAQGKIWKGNIKNKAKDGTIYWVETTIIPFLNKDGKPYQYLAIRSDISDKKLAEEKIRLNEIKFESIINQYPQPIVMLGADGSFISANPAWSKMFDAEIDSLVAYNVFADKELQANDMLQHYHKALQGEVVAIKKFLYNPSNDNRPGRERWLELLIYPVKNDDGIITQLIVFHEDCTAIKQAEDLVVKKEKILSAAQKVAHLSSWEVDLDDLETAFWSDEFYSILGIEINSIPATYSNFISFVHPDDVDFVKKISKQSLLTKIDFSYEARIVSADKTVKYIRSQCKFQKDAATKKYSMVGILHDITEAKKSERELQKKERLLSNAQTIAHIGGWEVNLSNYKAVWSDEAFRIFGLEPNEIEPNYEAFLSFIHPDDVGFVKKITDNGLQTKTDLDYDTRIITKQGIVKYINGQSKCYKDVSTNEYTMSGILHDITEKKTAEIELIAREKRFKAMIENADDIIALNNDKGEIMYLSPSFEKSTGFKVDDLIGKPAFDLMVPNQVPQSKKVLNDLLNNPGVPFHRMNQFKCKDGSSIWAEGTVTNWLHDENVKAIVSNYKNITDKKLAEEKLRASEAHFKSLIEYAPDVIIMVDESGNFMYTSPSFEKTTGYNFEEVKGKSSTIIMHPDSAVESKKFLLETIQNPGQPMLRNLKLKHKNGIEILCEGTVTNLLHNENVRAIVANYRNITDKKIAEEKLKASELHFKALIENAPDVIVLIDAEGKILYTSPSFEKTTGFTLDEMKGMSAFEIVHPDSVQASKEKVQEVLKNPGVVYPRLNHFLCKDGSSIWCEGTMTNLLHDENIKAIVVNYRNITDRKIAEEKLRENESRFRALIDNAPDVIEMLDAEGKIIYASPSLEKTTGFNIDELIGKNAIDIVHDDWKDKFRLSIHEVLNNPGVLLPRINHVVCKDGTAIWCEGSKINLLHDENVKAIVVNYRNITDKKLAEEKLQESETRFRALIENAPDVILMVDENWRAKYASPSFEKLTGYSLADVQEMGKFQVIHPDSLATLKEIHHNALGNPGVVYPRLNKLICKDGSVIWCEGTVINLLHEKDVNAIVVNFRNITDKKLAEEKYRESETRFKLLIENNFDGIILARNIHDMFYESPAIERITGWGKGEIQTIGIDNLLHPEDVDEVMMQIDKVARQPDFVQHSIHRLRHKTGKYIWIDATFTNLLDTPGINGILINISDVTERKMVEDRMIHINEELEYKVSQRTTDLEKTNKELEMFTYSVSHDLRTPLGAIDGFATLLSEFHTEQLDEEAKEYLKNIRISTKRMSRLIEDLLNLSKLGKKVIQTTELDMNELVKKVLHDYEATRKHQAQVTIHQLPVVKGDESILEQVWVNLISNAIKYSSKKENPMVEIGCEEKEQVYQFYIKDNGAGFDMQYADKLFGVFQRMHKNSEFEGTGVGLAIVKLIIEKHEGRIWVDSKLNEGTVFYFTLPK